MASTHHPISVPETKANLIPAPSWCREEKCGKKRSNPEGRQHKQLEIRESVLEIEKITGIGYVRIIGGEGSQFLASNDVDLQLIAHAWPKLPEAVRTAITMLVKANVPHMLDAMDVAEQRLKSREQLAI